MTRQIHLLPSGILLLTPLAVLAGCKGTEFKVPGTAAPKPKPKVVVKKVLTPEAVAAKKAKELPKEELEVIDKAYRASRSTTQSTGSPEEVAVRKVTAEVGKSLELGPVLVVWLLDCTTSNQKMLSGAVSGAKAWYETQDVRQMTLEGQKKLQTVIAGF